MTYSLIFYAGIDRSADPIYNTVAMIVQNVWNNSESYTHENWEFRDICVGFSRLYYIVDGEAYYEERGQKIRLKKHHLYLTPVKQIFTLTENPEDKLLHTFVHITTLPGVDRLIEIDVADDPQLADAVALWRKYAKTEDEGYLKNIVQLILGCIGLSEKEKGIVSAVRDYLDRRVAPVDMALLCRDLKCSREYMTRSFRDVYHMTPKQYWNQRRMDIALEKLCKGARVRDVAEELGFSTPYAFSKAFKNRFGLSPKKYIRTLNVSVKQSG